MSEPIDHEESSDCICNPDMETLLCDDGSVSFIFIHHSLEGSELEEIPREAI